MLTREMYRKLAHEPNIIISFQIQTVQLQVQTDILIALLHSLTNKVSQLKLHSRIPSSGNNYPANIGGLVKSKHNS